MYIDRASIFVKAGDGGSGCTSIYRDKYTRRGILDGGDGGKGGDVILEADRSIQTLLDFKYRRHFKAPSGKNGSGKNKKGAEGQDRIVKVPPGTIVKDQQSQAILRDLTKHGQTVKVAKGGEPGKGNKHLPQATSGEPGEERQILLELKIVADVGIIGYPNSGKSTLISRISKARPKVASYPFTTKAPVLGVVKLEDGDFVVADIPGLIEGAHQGKGLGDRFLRHIERTRLLIHLIDISTFEAKDPVDIYQSLNKELLLYSSKFKEKPQIVAANKIDLEGADQNLKKISKYLDDKVFPISALKGQGIQELVKATWHRLKQIKQKEEEND